ncbi:MAG: GNAT family N-acetyltransferase, partial [Candidatus Hodarchaeota archaeon]
LRFPFLAALCIGFSPVIKRQPTKKVRGKITKYKLTILMFIFRIILIPKIKTLDLKYKLESTPDSVIIADDNGDIIGMVLVDIGRDPYSGQILGQIYNFIIESEYRTKGIGSKLIESALDFCRKKKVSLVRVNARRDVKAAVKLYEKFGFSESFIVMEQELD